VSIAVLRRVVWCIVSDVAKDRVQSPVL